MDGDLRVPLVPLRRSRLTLGTLNHFENRCITTDRFYFHASALVFRPFGLQVAWHSYTIQFDGMIRPKKVEAFPDYRLFLTYPDGVEGVIDLAGEVGHGVFAPLANEEFFRTVHLGSFGQIAWSEDLEICPDAAYREIVGRLLTEPVHV